MTLVRSRSLSSAEQRYAPVEGEAVAVAWGLEQTKYFTQGCDNLAVVTDHKPSTKIFGDRTLGEITNTRLLRLKQRTLMRRFQIFYLYLGRLTGPLMLHRITQCCIILSLQFHVTSLTRPIFWNKLLQLM